MIIYIGHLCHSAVDFCQRRGVASDNACVVVRDIGRAIAPFVGPAANTHTHTHTCIHIHLHACACLCVCVLCVYMYTHIIVGAFVFCVRMCVCADVYANMYADMYADALAQCTVFRV